MAPLASNACLPTGLRSLSWSPQCSRNPWGSPDDEEVYLVKRFVEKSRNIVIWEG